MKTFVKDNSKKLESTHNLNYTMAVQNFDKKMEQYVQKQIQDKQRRDDYEHHLTTLLRKKKLKDIQNYHIEQMTTKNKVLRASNDQSKRDLYRDDYIKAAEFMDSPNCNFTSILLIVI